MGKYDFHSAEKRWQKAWRKEGTYEPDLEKAKNPFYNLMMFPYPSAEGLHVGNMYAFVGSDIYGRFNRMRGRDVFEPIGLDGFGIHSENYALKVGTHPMEQAKVSEKRFYEQLEAIGNGFAWEEKLETYNPEYYRWTQWIFVHMFKNGLAYRKKQEVNWCPSDKTVLADEQVVDGKCERCGAEVIKKELEQWFFKITDYAERLLKNLESLDWSEKVKIAQRAWIGKSEGSEIVFDVVFPGGGQTGKIPVFTTRADTLFGATFLVFSPEHPWVKLAIDDKHDFMRNKSAVKEYVENAGKKTEIERLAVDKEKTGIRVEGAEAVNPATGEKMPIFIADYVLAHYGTGAIMAVPAHDERDFEFAKKYNLPMQIVIRKSRFTTIKYVTRSLVVDWEKQINPKLYQYRITQDFVEFSLDDKDINEFIPIGREILKEGPYYFSVRGNSKLIVYKDATFDIFQEGADKKAREYGRKLSIPEDELNWSDAMTEKGILVNSGRFGEMDSEKAKREITKFVGGKQRIQYRLRDWLISRQRYWGPPIPMIFCDSCAAQGKGERADMPGWYTVSGEDLPVELPLIKDFRPTGKDESPLAAHKEFYEVKCPACRANARRETDVSDTFLDSAWYYLRYLNPKNKESALDTSLIKKWLPVEMYIGGAEHAVLHLLYVRFVAMALHNWGLVHFEEPMKTFRAHGLLIKDGAKMSKSKGNVINPDEYIENFGADTLRMYLMFIAPFEQGGDFRDSGMLGVERFLKRVWKLWSDKHAETSDKKNPVELEKIAHRTIKKVTDDIESLRYNTAVSALMIFLNKIEEIQPSLSHVSCLVFLKLLAPFAPHMAEEIWRNVLGNKTSIHREPWPEFDEKLIQEEKFTLVIQVNGKVRDSVEVEAGISEQKAREVALARERIITSMGSQKPKRVIYVRDKLINIVL